EKAAVQGAAVGSTAAAATAPAAPSKAPAAPTGRAPAQSPQQRNAPTAQRPAQQRPVQGQSAAPAQADIPTLSDAPRSGGAGSAQVAAGSTGAGSQGKTGAAASAQPVAAPAPYGRLREIYAREGDELKIGLDGLGFLFLGLPDRGDQANGMSFKSKENRDNKTWFTFRALKLGSYDLDFQQQDNATGTTNKETVRVHVVSDQDFAAATVRQPDAGDTATSVAEPGDPAFAARLAAAGAYDAAVAELLKGYRDGNPSLNDQIAALYMKMGSLDAAAKYYAKNLAPQGPWAQAAVLGLTKIAVAQKDQQDFMGLLKQFLAVDDASAEETLIGAVRMEKDLKQVGVGLDLAGAYVKRFPTGRWRDEADFLAAQMLEADTPFRDIARAGNLYRGIVKDFPESQFAEPARQRLLYIERHFFQVR
ncbi:MAG TPA: hypothetical protein VHE79_15810, partial [Spirochaetia bacterium]